ncbi:MAG TPA: sterol desaturase family protein [Pseudomonas sp.]|nr:sterol desaturase family protein [Pseudomonas sp.]
MNYILYAVPVFFLLIGLELLVDRWRGVGNYRLADTLNSLSAGVLSTTSGLLTKCVGLLSYTFAWQQWALFELSADSLGVWLFAFVFYDLCYYWLHRLGHERNLLWAAHSVHHQSEDYNLSTALRQSSTGFLFGWIFYLPMALAGIPPLVFLTVAALNLLYQFWVHTRHVPKLGWLEWAFVTPSNHRAHHGQNAVYMDRNYGGVFILWDRLFGTFQEELDAHPVIFGVTTPLASWNPLWANLQFYVALWHDAVRAERRWDKWRIWFMPTGWRPADVAARYPQAKSDLSRFVKFEVPLSRVQKLYAALQFAVYVLGGSYLLAGGDALGLPALLLGWVWMVFGLYSLGAWLENRPWAVTLEVARLLLNVPALTLAQQVGLLPGEVLGWGLLAAYSLLSGLVLLGLRRRATAAQVGLSVAFGARRFQPAPQPEDAAQQQQGAQHP